VLSSLVSSPLMNSRRFLCALQFLCAAWLACGDVHARGWQCFTPEEIETIWNAGEQERQQRAEVERNLRVLLPHLRNPSIEDLKEEEDAVVLPTMIVRADRTDRSLLRQTDGHVPLQNADYMRAEVDRRTASQFFNWRPGASRDSQLWLLDPVKALRQIREKGFLSIFAAPEQ